MFNQIQACPPAINNGGQNGIPCHRRQQMLEYKLINNMINEQISSLLLILTA
jgi:hypothetical protein